MRTGICSLAAAYALSAIASAQSCPKVTYTTPTATMKSLVASVNCLVSSAAEKPKSIHSEVPKTEFLVEAFPIVGPQHTHSYRRIVFAMVSVPAGNEIKTALVTPDAPEGSVAATMGAECKIKINPDSTVESQCNLTGGTLYVIHHN
jgi:hypothetical protein